ncbi:hypothetical protein [Granulicoccus phenolivorans]|uniref:hypothetical protein n=1 Tax=Granulicoccus phenolivorans TaxID=266854 RepID=UPI00047917EC|nr:hypothetical protein [Granulicoccus phenolivorans]
MAVDEYDALILASTRSYGVLGRPSARASRLEAVIEACSGARQSVVVANQGSSARRTRGPVMGIAEGVETLGHCSPAAWLLVVTSQCSDAAAGLARVIATLAGVDDSIDGVVALNEADKPLYLVAAYRREALVAALHREMDTKHPRLGSLVADLRLVEAPCADRAPLTVPTVSPAPPAQPVAALGAALAARA